MSGEMERKLYEIERLLERLNQIERGNDPVWLETPLTSTSWDGDAKTTANNGLIDLSSVFSAPAGIKAVTARIEIKGTMVGVFGGIGGSTSAYSVGQTIQVVNTQISGGGIVPCNSSGDIYFYCNGNLAEVKIEIFGYWM